MNPCIFFVYYAVAEQKYRKNNFGVQRNGELLYLRIDLSRESRKIGSVVSGRRPPLAGSWDRSGNGDTLLLLEVGGGRTVLL